MDTVTAVERSKIMAAVKSTGTKSTELELLAALKQARIKGWRYQPPGVIGHPDFVFPRHRVAIFVDGCFWHGCPRCYRRPTSSRSYWDMKLMRNMQRDSRVRAQLRRLGWRVIRVWEHSLRPDPLAVVRRVQRFVDRRSPSSSHKVCRSTG